MTLIGRAYLNRDTITLEEHELDKLAAFRLNATEMQGILRHSQDFNAKITFDSLLSYCVVNERMFEHSTSLERRLQGVYLTLQQTQNLEHRIADLETLRDELDESIQKPNDKFQDLRRERRLRGEMDFSVYQGGVDDRRRLARERQLGQIRN